MYKLKFEIPGTPPSLNKTLRLYRHSRNKIYKVWYDSVAMLTVGKRPAKPLESAHIQIIRYNYRMMDYDGVVGSLKPVVDGLQHAGIIYDDSWKVIGAWHVDQQYIKKGQEKIVVEVFEL